MKDHTMEKKERVARMKQLANRFDSTTIDVVKKVTGKLQILQVMNWYVF